VGIVCNEMRSKLRATGTKKSAKEKEIFCKQYTKICILQCKIKRNTGHYANIFVLSTQPALHLKTQRSYTNKYVNVL
jgi:hypothetical protein